MRRRESFECDGRGNGRTCRAAMCPGGCLDDERESSVSVRRGER